MLNFGDPRRTLSELKRNPLKACLLGTGFRRTFSEL